MGQIRNAVIVGAVLGVGMGLVPTVWFAEFFILGFLLFPLATAVLLGVTLLAFVLVPMLFPGTRRVMGGLLRLIGQGLWIILVFIAVVFIRWFANSQIPFNQGFFDLLLIAAVVAVSCAVIFAFLAGGAALEKKVEKATNVPAIPSLSFAGFVTVTIVFVQTLVLVSILKGPENDAGRLRMAEIVRVAQQEVPTGELELPVAFTAPVKLGDGRILLAGNWGVVGDNPRVAVIIDSSAHAVMPVQRRRNYEYASGIQPYNQIVQGWFGARVKVLPPLGPAPRGFLMADGSVVLVGGLRPPWLRGALPAIPAQRWDARTGTWSVVPELGFSISPFLHEGTVLEDIVQRTSGDLVLFDRIGNISLSGRIQARLWSDISGQQENLGILLKWRSRFSAVELADGRIAVVGGVTKAEYIALDKDCTHCPDEYVSFGDTQDARSTEVYDFAARKWSPGPYSRYPGGVAVRLSGGQVVKVSLRKESREVAALEIADASFTRWKLASPPPASVRFSFKKAVALDKRVLLLDDTVSAEYPGLVWNSENDRWSVWRPDREMFTDQVIALDGKRVFILGGWRHEHLIYRTVEVP